MKYCYRVLLSFVGFTLVFLGFTLFYRVLPSFIELGWILLSYRFTEFYLVLLVNLT